MKPSREIIIVLGVLTWVEDAIFWISWAVTLFCALTIWLSWQALYYDQQTLCCVTLLISGILMGLGYSRTLTDIVFRRIR